MELVLFFFPRLFFIYLQDWRVYLFEKQTNEKPVTCPGTFNHKFVDFLTKSELGSKEQPTVSCHCCCNGQRKRGKEMGEGRESRHTIILLFSLMCGVKL